MLQVFHYADPARAAHDDMKGQTMTPTMKLLDPRDSFAFQALKHPATWLGIVGATAASQIPVPEAGDKVIFAATTATAMATIGLTPTIWLRTMAIPRIAKQQDHLYTGKGDHISKYMINSGVSFAVSGLALISAGLGVAIPELGGSIVPLLMSGGALANSIIWEKLTRDHVNRIQSA